MKNNLTINAYAYIIHHTNIQYNKIIHINIRYANMCTSIHNVIYKIVEEKFYYIYDILYSISVLYNRQKGWNILAFSSCFFFLSSLFNHNMRGKIHNGDSNSQYILYNKYICCYFSVRFLKFQMYDIQRRTYIYYIHTL